jgi:hypothetical protein
MRSILREIVQISREWTAKMFHVKHLCVAFAVKHFTLARAVREGVREVVEGHKTFNFFRTLKPHEVSDFQLVKKRAAPCNKA